MGAVYIVAVMIVAHISVRVAVEGRVANSGLILYPEQPGVERALHNALLTLPSVEDAGPATALVAQPIALSVWDRGPEHLRRVMAMAALKGGYDPENMRLACAPSGWDTGGIERLAEFSCKSFAPGTEREASASRVAATIEGFAAGGSPAHRAYRSVADDRLTRGVQALYISQLEPAVETSLWIHWAALLLALATAPFLAPRMRDEIAPKLQAWRLIGVFAKPT